MTTARVHLLCTGDLHLGRFPTRVPADVRELSVEHVWKQIVSEAIRRRVDALVLTGDVADRQNAFFEAFGALKREVERLVEAGIPTFAVAGNHDYEVLGRLVDSLDTPLVRLVGRDATWELAHLERDGAPVLGFVGWSFHQPHVNTSPLGSFPERLDRSVPLVGLLHADLDVPESPYAPVPAADLLATPVPIWILGHIHKPQHRSERGRHILYPGSPQPLHPAEPGVHGPWLVEIEDGRHVRLEQLPLATLRYERIEVDVSAAEDLNDLQAHALRQIARQLEALPQQQPPLRHIVVRAVLTGRTRHHRALVQARADWEGRIATSVGDVGVSVERLVIGTRPDYDLAEVAQRKDPAGALARLLQGLDEHDPRAQRVLHAATADLQALVGSNAFRPLNERLSPAAIEALARERLRRQGLLLLDTLLEQADGEAP